MSGKKLKSFPIFEVDIRRGPALGEVELCESMVFTSGDQMKVTALGLPSGEEMIQSSIVAR